mgnify:CR=1 FL=1
MNTLYKISSNKLGIVSLRDRTAAQYHLSGKLEFTEDFKSIEVSIETQMTVKQIHEMLYLELTEGLDTSLFTNGTSDTTKKRKKNRSKKNKSNDVSLTKVSKDDSLMDTNKDDSLMDTNKDDSLMDTNKDKLLTVFEYEGILAYYFTKGNYIYHIYNTKDKPTDESSVTYELINGIQVETLESLKLKYDLMMFENQQYIYNLVVPQDLSFYIGKTEVEGLDPNINLNTLSLTERLKLGLLCFIDAEQESELIATMKENSLLQPDQEETVIEDMKGIIDKLNYIYNLSSVLDLL